MSMLHNNIFFKFSALFSLCLIYCSVFADDLNNNNTLNTSANNNLSIILDDQQSELSAAKYLQSYIDESNSLTTVQVADLEDNLFLPNSFGSIKLSANKANWLKLNLSLPDSQNQQEWLFEFFA